MPGYKNNLLPIYTATQSLDVNYKFNYCIYEDAEVVVPAAKNHAILYQGYKGLTDNVLAVKSKLQPYEKANFATAMITYLYTDTTTEEGYLGEDVEQKTIVFFCKA